MPLSHVIRAYTYCNIVQEQRNEGDSDDEGDHMTQMEIERRQEEIEELTEKVETAKKDQKELFLIVFQVIYVRYLYCYVAFVA